MDMSAPPHQAAASGTASDPHTEVVCVDAVRQSPGHARARTAQWRLDRPWKRAALLLGILLVLEVGVFGEFLLGTKSPPWDFFGSYNTSAYYWWTYGSFFHPVEWMPSLWGGYPAAAELQNSGWYLPVGVAAALTPFTMWSSAVLAALHVGFGAVGAHVLVRRLGGRYAVAIFAAVAWFFAVGNFSNAEHLDIARGYAWLPWVLLVLSPRWPWRSWWAIPVASLALWQAVTATYPGMLVALVYVAVFWIAMAQWSTRPALRDYLLPLCVAGAGAALLSAPRLLPYLSLGASGAAGMADESQFSWAMVGTTVYGYGAPQLPNDVTMRSYFLPATVLLLLGFGAWHDLRLRLGIALVVPAFMLGMPFLPWFDLLPGMQASRFTMNDFKPYLLLGLLLIACGGLQRLLDPTPIASRRRRSALVFVTASILALAGIGYAGPFTPADLALGVVGLALAAIVLVALLGTRRWRLTSSLATRMTALLAVTALCGAAWAITNREPWRTDRAAAERHYFDQTVDELLASRHDSGATPTRPSREPLDIPITAKDLESKNWHRVVYTGDSAVGGYINLKGFEAHRTLEDALLDPDTGPGTAEFLAAPGTMVTFDNSDDDAAASALAGQCTSTGDCGSIASTPVSYDPGHFQYLVNAPSASTALLNEPYFQGWTAELCTNDTCTPTDVTAGPLGLVTVEIPTGEHTLHLDYHTPKAEMGWILFWAGVGLLLLGGAAGLLRRGPGPSRG